MRPLMPESILRGFPRQIVVDVDDGFIELAIYIVRVSPA